MDSITRKTLFSRAIAIMLLALLVMASPLSGCIGGEKKETVSPSGGVEENPIEFGNFTMLWRHAGFWDEHQTVYGGKVFCPMCNEDPPNLKVVDLYTGNVERQINLSRKSATAPFFAHGRVYLFCHALETEFGGSGTVCVINMTTWKIENEWSVDYGADVEVFPYDSETDCFYLPSGCYKASTGEKVWSTLQSAFPPYQQFMDRGGALIVGNTVYYHNPCFFRAYDKKTGSPLWSLPLAHLPPAQATFPLDVGNTYNTPIYDSDHGLIYIGTDWFPYDDGISDAPWRSGTVYAIDAEKQQVAWQRIFEGNAIKSVLTYHRGRLFVPLYNTPDGTRVALYWKDGSTLWENAVDGDDGWATSAVDDRYLYTASHGRGSFIIQDQATGEVVWRTEAGLGICCAPIISGGVVIVGTEADYFAVKIGEGKLVDVPWKGNSNYTGYTPEGVYVPEEEKAPFAE
ncbi:MAG: PQQ-binding-like beta-propeller repeat protein [Candidatus Thermoplasmatota archaeon]|nr:PQQ-binding-like beta-propeller repeat protein [Candidatus Thermoplasmatota archaeon]